MGQVNFSQSLNLSLFDLRYEPKLIHFMRQVQANNSLAYTVARTEENPVSAQLIGYNNWLAAIASLDPAETQPLLVNSSLQLASKPASERMDEVWRIVTGTSEFPGTDENADSLLTGGNTGNLGNLETKIRDFGTFSKAVTESHTATGGTGSVQVNFPIYDVTSIAAWKAGNVPLTVHSVVNANLGQVILYDGGSPVANVAVTVTYTLRRHTVYFLYETLLDARAQREQVDAVLVSQELMSYIATNS
jgi:hypothetical protein